VYLYVYALYIAIAQSARLKHVYIYICVYIFGRRGGSWARDSGPEIKTENREERGSGARPEIETKHMGGGGPTC